MFRSLDHPQGANNVPSQSYMLEISYYIICFSDAAAYHVYVYMLYSLQGGLSTLDRPPCKEYNMYTYTRYAAASPKHKVFIFLTYNFSKEQYVLPEDDLRIERCRNVLNVSV